MRARFSAFTVGKDTYRAYDQAAGGNAWAVSFIDGAVRIDPVTTLHRARSLH
jgi:hypothetical protein